MALRMARPWQDPKTHVWHLRQRTPLDLVDRLKGQRVALPVGDQVATVKVGAHVQVSLRTKDSAKAKELHATADAALRKLWDAKRNGPRRLSHKEAVALAGDFYRAKMEALWKSDDGQRLLRMSEAIGVHQEVLEDRGEGFPEALRDLFAQMQSKGIDPLAIVTPPDRRLDPAIAESAFGAAADHALALRGLAVDTGSRAMVIAELRRAVRDSAEQSARQLKGDYRPDPNLVRFPEWTPETPSPAATKPGAITAQDLFDRWAKAQGVNRAASTVSRYQASWRSFIAFTKQRDVRELADTDVYAWAQHRRDAEGIAARTVNKNDLVAVSSVFRWACGLGAGRLLPSNPASGVNLDAPAVTQTRERAFRDAEVLAILRAADAVQVDPENPTLSHAKRWCPWLAAYSGARIAELTGLTGADIRNEGGVPVMDFRKTKTGIARTVPLHPHLVELGFLDFVRERGAGPLFFDPRRHGKAPKTDPATSRGSKLGKWVRTATGLDPNVDPNHGWRHTFKTRALGAGIDSRIRDAITGHSVGSVARGYEAPPVGMLAAAMDTFPTYKV